jgi:uncharacterized protein YlaI
MKNCTKCGEQKPLSEFYKSTKAYDGLQARCKICHNIVTKDYNYRNKKKRNLYSKKYNIEKTYGISFSEYESLIKFQNSKCAICDKDLQDGKQTHVDHDHKTNAIRGILCSKCNTGLGLFNDSTDILKSAIMYITKHSKKVKINVQ